MTDPFWVREKGEKVSFEEVNLYENHLDNTFIDIALRGRQYTVDNEKLAKDLSTNGCFPKAWKRVVNGFVLLKDGGNWGVLVKNSNNKPVSLHKLMDFNQAFHSYDGLEGANCQTTFGVRMNQQEAAEEAVKKIGMNQIYDVKKEWFGQLPQYYEMFIKRYEYLKGI